MMTFIKDFKASLHSPNSYSFDERALTLFQFQYINNSVYKKFIDHLKINPDQVNSIEKIPFLPIDFFKHHIVSSINQYAGYFSSSGTTGSIQSKHYYSNLTFYLNNCVHIFESTYFPLKETLVLGLVPSYLEREGSSLIAMIRHFIERSNMEESGFYLYNHDDLYHTLIKNKEKRILLIGVTFALLDFAEKFSLNDFNHLSIMETGGMKGRKKEMTRAEVHGILKQKLNVPTIHSEYGMTELLSQSYSKQNGIFNPPNTMRVFVRETNDPLSIQKNNRTGGINIIDLANAESCAFIATDDLGKTYEDGSFEVLGRFDHSDIRGCNLMSL